MFLLILVLVHVGRVLQESVHGEETGTKVCEVELFELDHQNPKFKGKTDDRHTSACRGENTPLQRQTLTCTHTPVHTHAHVCSPANWKLVFRTRIF